MVDGDIVDQILSREDEDIETLVASMEERTDDLEEHEIRTTGYGSDEEGFDHLFNELMTRDQGSTTMSHTDQNCVDTIIHDEGMDMSTD